MAQTPKGQLSLKRIGVDKTNGRIVAVTAGAAFLVVFFLVASYSLFGTLTYQNKIIKGKKDAVKQLQTNLTARDSLVKSYKTFAASPVNIIGGSSTGGGAQDGASPKIVLDALPSKYDFPALASSLEKMAADQKVEIVSITGTDDEVAQTSSEDASKPVEIPFQIQVSGEYVAVQSLVNSFARSVRPITVKAMKVTGNQSRIQLDITAVTYYQPEKVLSIKSEVVK